MASLNILPAQCVLAFLSLVIPLGEAITFDKTVRVVNDSSLWETSNMKSIHANMTWTPDVVNEMTRKQYGPIKFRPQFLTGLNYKTNEYMLFSGTIYQLTSEERAIAEKHFASAELDPKYLVVFNGYYKLLLIETDEQLAEPISGSRFVRVFEVKDGTTYRTDVKPDECDCMFDFDSLRFTVGTIEGHSTTNFYSSSCPGIRMCVMTSNGALSSMLSIGVPLDLKRTVKTLLNYELALHAKRCTRSDFVEDVTGFIQWFVKEKPDDKAFDGELNDKKWTLLC